MRKSGQLSLNVGSNVTVYSEQGNLPVLRERGTKLVGAFWPIRHINAIIEDRVA